MIDKLINRTTCRNYLDKPISKDIINKLKQIINSSPTAINIQPFSAIFITNKKIKEELIKFNFNQPHIIQAPLIILFFADLNRTFHNQKITNGFSKYVDVTIDTTIACSLVMAGANDLGLGTCILGGFRK
jgi:nitroreductase